MTKQDQIEQMARITCQMYCRQYEKRCAGVAECDYKCLHYQRCEALYDAGYHKQPEWISVEDRQPTEADGTVLVCMPDLWPYNNKEPFVNAKHDCRVMEAHYSEFSNSWTYGMGSRSIDYNPTHWMQLPTPPTE